MVMVSPPGITITLYWSLPPFHPITTKCDYSKRGLVCVVEGVRGSIRVQSLLTCSQARKKTSDDLPFPKYRHFLAFLSNRISGRFWQIHVVGVFRFYQAKDGFYSHMHISQIFPKDSRGLM